MKLSCSAYQAGSSSYAQKILNSGGSGHPQNYGAISSTNPTGDSSHGITMPTWNVEEIEGKCSPNETEFGAEVSYQGEQQQQQGGSGSTGGSGNVASSSRPSVDGGGAGGVVLGRGESSRRTSSSLSHHSADGHPDLGGKQSDSTSISKAAATSSCSPSESPAHRSKSNQRWMKLRTTVQLSGAIQTIQQKKAPLKREDSFLKRFSTRQIPEAQETFEIGDDDGSGGGGGEWSKQGRKKRRSLPRSVVNPDSNFFFYWLMLLTTCVLYNLWTLIVRQSFPELQANARLFWILSDAFSDIIFLLDVAVQFRTGYLEQGLMVYQTKKLAKHYVGSKPFYLDLFSLLPTDLFQLYFGVNPMFRFPRFLKVYRIYNYYYMVESRTVYPNVWRVVNLIHILLLLAHWFGCFYYLISEAEGFEGHWGYPNPNNFSEFAPLTRKYLGSLYWSTLTLTTIGDLPPPHSNWQYLFTIVSYLIGVFIFATIVGQVGNVITNRNANRLEFERLLDGAKTYMRHHKVPRNMQRRVLRWYDYSWSRGRIQGGGDINTALGLLPDKLKTELALHVNLSVLKKVTIFQECQPEFLHDLVLKMKAYIFTPGDLICRKGEVAREMFIIADGILEVISETGKVLTTMEAGNFFGEIGILNLDGLNKRTADVRSVGYSELFSLSREDVLAAMKDYPEAQEILQTLGRKRLMEARKSSGPAVPKKVIEPKKGSPVPGVVTSGLIQSSSTYSNKDVVAVEVDTTTRKRIVEKLRSDVKGLRNAIRRSRRSNSSKEESSDPESCTVDGEQPSSSGRSRKESSASVRGDGTKSFPPPRGVLKRMHNVVLSDEKEPSSPSTPTTSIPLSLKSVLSAATKRVQLPRAPSISHPPPAPAAVETQELIGAGLPLIQRLRLLRQKEEREKKQAEERDALLKMLIPSNLSISSPTSSPPNLQTTRAAVETYQKASSAIPLESHQHPLPFSAQLRQGDHQQRGSVSSAEGPGSGYSSPASSSLPLLGTFSPKSASLLIGEAAAAAVLKVTTAESSKSTISTNPSSFPPVWTASPPRGPLANMPSSSSSSSQRRQEDNEEDLTEDSSLVSHYVAAGTDGERPSGLRLRQQLSASKNYGSVDDLSPEFSRLPFIKKLKILNERQKIAELLMTKSANSVLTRSTSEGSNENPSVPGELLVGPDAELLLHSVHLGRRTQSHREGQQVGDNEDVSVQQSPLISPPLTSPHSKDEYATQPPRPSTSDTTSTHSAKRKRRKKPGSRNNNKGGKKPDGNEGSTEDSSSSPPAEEDNETPERRNLKSILKKLAQFEDQEEGEEHEKEKELLKSQTILGYAARHRKYTKNVTFHRQGVTLRSPDELPTSSSSPPAPTPPLHLPSISALETQQPETSLPPPVTASVVLHSVTQTTTTTATARVDPNSPFTQENIKTLSSLLVQTTHPVKTTELEKTTTTSPPVHYHGLNFAQEECIGSVVIGLRTIIETKLDEIRAHFQSRFDTLEQEVKRRDQLITLLHERIQELECYGDHGHSSTSVAALLRQCLPHNHIDREEGSSDDDDIEYQRGDASLLFSRGDSIDTVISAQEYFDDDDVFEREAHTSASHGKKQQPKARKQQQEKGFTSNFVGGSWGHTSPPSGGAEKASSLRTSQVEPPAPWQLEFHRDRDSLPPPNRNGGSGAREDDVRLDMTGQASTSEYESTSEDDNEASSGIQLTETKVSLDDDDDDEEEEVEEDGDDDFDNKDWEIQLLAKEMEKREELKKTQLATTAASSAVVDEMRELENEIEEMTAAVTTGSLSPSELDMLESMLQTKTKRMKALVKALSVESSSVHAEVGSSKSKVGRSYDDFRRGSASSGGGPSGYKPLVKGQTTGSTESRSGAGFFSRSGGTGNLKRQSSLYERTLKGKSGGGSDSGRRESAGAIITGSVGGANKGQQRKQSFLSRFSMVRQFSSKLGSGSQQESLDDENASQQHEIPTLSSKSGDEKKETSTTTTTLCSPRKDTSVGLEEMSAKGESDPSLSKGDGCDIRAMRKSGEQIATSSDQNYEECQPLLTK
ncbi:uncharacterized protein LOC110861989 isoform X3 [Folsomia candida]|uniref:uncharacterized protein LOC110861989 isoform X3 n=1 Tax=Folsomia candida TaxID=158441 RepID=UPI0016050B43|nr:uncharacterized protein LOC110861989 isoform X3 [Folsomia candida]